MFNSHNMQYVSLSLRRPDEVPRRARARPAVETARKWKQPINDHTREDARWGFGKAAGAFNLSPNDISRFGNCSYRRAVLLGAVLRRPGGGTPAGPQRRT